jgi:hypothetical protein
MKRMNKQNIYLLAGDLVQGGGCIMVSIHHNKDVRQVGSMVV